MTDPRCERQLESAISRAAAAIATPPTISTNPRVLNSARIITPVTYLAMPEIPSCAAGGQSINQVQYKYPLLILIFNVLK